MKRKEGTLAGRVAASALAGTATAVFLSMALLLAVAMLIRAEKLGVEQLTLSGAIVGGLGGLAGGFTAGKRCKEPALGAALLSGGIQMLMCLLASAMNDKSVEWQVHGIGVCVSVMTGSAIGGLLCRRGARRRK